MAELFQDVLLDVADGLRIVYQKDFHAMAPVAVVDADAPVLAFSMTIPTSRWNSPTLVEGFSQAAIFSAISTRTATVGTQRGISLLATPATPRQRASIFVGFHAPTVYFPLDVPEALMVEPTETESMETLDAFAAAIVAIVAEDPEFLRAAPHTTPVSRPDEVAAGRHPVFCGSACATE